MKRTATIVLIVLVSQFALSLGRAGTQQDASTGVPPSPPVGGWLYYPTNDIRRGVPVREFSRALKEGKYLATIDPATGRVITVEIAQSCGSPWLDVSARKQILQWRARPHGYTRVYVPMSFHPK